MDPGIAYSKRPLWQWILLYLVIGGLIYFLIYFFIVAKKNGTIINQKSTPSGNTILVTTKGFEPNTLTVNSGTIVTWNNQSGDTANVSSDPHPTHTDYPPLNLGNFANNASVSLSFPNPGNYKYHNHLQPDQTGTITVR